MPIFAVILAGGSGTRFWPLSRSQYPKQVLSLLGADSMLQATIERLSPRIPLDRITVVTNEAQADIIRLDLYRKGREQVHLLLEPFGRNTAMAVGLAAVQVPGLTDEDVMAVFPADHYIREQGKFLEALDAGAAGPGGVSGDLRYQPHPSGYRLWLHQAWRALGRPGHSF